MILLTKPTFIHQFKILAKARNLLAKMFGSLANHDQIPRQMIQISGLLILIAFSTQCSSGSARRSNTAKNSLPKPTPTMTPSPVPNPVVPPVNAESGASISTGAQGEVKQFSLQTASGSTPVDGRYLDEYLFIVSATEKSCLKLSVRPGSDITSGASIENLPDASASTEGCEAAAAAPPSTAASGKTSLTSNSHSSLNLEFKEKFVEGTGFGLTAAAIPLCSQSNFYMQAKGTAVTDDPLAHSQDPSKVVKKLGMLLAKSSDNKVLVYADQEWLSPSYCNPASTDNNGFTGFDFSMGSDLGSVTPFNLLNNSLNKVIYRGYKDILLKSHFTNLAKSTSEALTKLTATFGQISDVDSNSAVKVFISPEINRVYSDIIYSNKVDAFSMQPIYKPMDLARNDPLKNPSSNQAETIYLWAPNPGGEYNYSNYPSSNSINSNYAYGFIGNQIMNLIMDNQKLIKGTKEEAFLRESLAFLGGMYIGGSNFTWSGQAHYLASHYHNITLTGNLDDSLFPGSTIFEGTYGQRGLRALFGWYLHSKMCTPSSGEPCAAIKSMIASTKVGIAAVEEALNLPWATIISNFAGSIAVGLIRDMDQTPTQIAAFLQAAEATAAVPAPLLLQNDIETDTHSVTEVKASLTLVDSTSYSKNNNTLEKAFVTPYPSLSSQAFLPLLPESNLDLTLQAGSMTFLRVTGLITDVTDISAYIGPYTRVSIIPIGKRDQTKRAIYHEKLGENAFLDLRPINLTDKPQSPLGGNIRYTWELSPPVSQTTGNYTVTQNKEIWISGSVDNTLINIEGAPTPIGDSDAYVLKLDPCNGPCSAGKAYQVIVQTYIRPGSPDFLPMTFIGPVNKTAYHGAMVWGNVKDIKPDYQAPKDDKIHFPVLCHSAQLYSGNNNESNLCNNGGYNRVFNTKPGSSNTDSPTTPYESQIIDSASTPSTGTDTNFIKSICNISAAGAVPEDACWGNLYKAPKLFDSRLRMNLNIQNTSANLDKTNYGYGFLTDNFLMSAYGYPYDTSNTMVFDGDISRPDGPKPFTKEEANRMFFNFKYNKDLKPTTLDFYSARTGFSVDRNLGAIPKAHLPDGGGVFMSDDMISAIKNAITVISTKGTVLPDGSDPNVPADPFIAVCTGTLGLEKADCIQAGSNTTLFNKLKSKILADNLIARCEEKNPQDCDAYEFFIDIDTKFGATAPKAELIEDENKFIWVQQATTDSIETFYKPKMLSKARNGSCSGEGRDYGIDDKGWRDSHLLASELLDRISERELPPIACDLKYVHEKIAGTDIREQIWLPTKLIGCESFPSTHQLCIDDYTTQETTTFGKMLTSADFSCQKATGDFERDVRAPIYFRKGEVIGLLGRVHQTEFTIQGVTNPANFATYATLVVGGRNQTKGDYLMRVRVKEISPCNSIPDGFVE